MFDWEYYNVVDQIYHSRWSIDKLKRIEILKWHINNIWPKGHKTKFLQVAGTNGKGSTARFLEAGLSLFGKSGCLLSPHLFEYRERITIEGNYVSRDDICKTWNDRLKGYCIEVSMNNNERVPTFHEINILMAMHLFDEYDVEWGVVEAGMGGRYDQSSALAVLGTILTNVGNDHEIFLGQESWQRALDKGGIAKKGIPFFTSETDTEILGLIKSICDYTGSSFYKIEKNEVSEIKSSLSCFMQNNKVNNCLLSGKHQHVNAALSLKVIKNLIGNIDLDEYIKSCCKIKFLGRFYQYENNVYIDIAHNVDKLSVLMAHIDEDLGNKEKILVVGLSGNRSFEKFYALIRDKFRKIIISSSSFKGQKVEDIELNCKEILEDESVVIISHPKEAYAYAKKIKKEDEVIVISGSTYLIEQALNEDRYMSHINGTYGWRNI